MHPHDPFPRLQAGDTVAVIAPAGPVKPEVLAQVPALYDAVGLRCKLYPGCRAFEPRTGYLAGSDDLRLADLHAALADPEAVAIHCLRGGYGAMRLLHRVDAALVRRAHKLLVGYSDITALHALWAREGLMSLHAPMPASDLVQSGHEADGQALFSLLHTGLPAGTTWAPVLDAHGTAGLRLGGRARGTLVGGNLSLVAALIGTPWSWRFEGAVLFLEDVTEDGYRVDRYLSQLELAGALDAVAGFVLGSFTESDLPTAVLEDFILARGKPVLGGWPAGHGTPNRPLPMNLPVLLDADAGTLTFEAALLT